MKDYKKIIIKNFKRAKLEPRDYQIKVINEILNAFIDDRESNVVLNAPTGSGKSAIALVTMLSLNEINYNDRLFETIDDFGKPELIEGGNILMHLNVLVHQYEDMIKPISNAMVLVGANNYYCDVHSCNADSCTYSEDIRAKKYNLECNCCEYKKDMILKASCNYFITNYAYFFVANFKAKLINIFDECHLIDDAYNSANTTIINAVYILNLFGNVTYGLSDTKINELLMCLEHVNETNYKELITEFLQSLVQVINKIQEGINCYINDTEETNIKTLANLKSQYKKHYYEYLKLKKYLKEECEHVVDIYFQELDLPEEVDLFNIKYTTKNIKLQPIFIRNELSYIEDSSKFKLFMSATNPVILYDEVMKLKSYKVINIPPVFDKSLKTIVETPIAKMNFKAMNDDKVFSNIVSFINKISMLHKNENGLILVPSFVVAEQLKEMLNIEHEMFVHSSETPLYDLLETYTASNNLRVLVTPSGYEGLNLYDDLGKWQIIIKAPYANLNDKRIKYISENYNSVYMSNTLVKIVQGSGRCTRHKDDKSVTYLLDMNAINLFESNMNIWKDEFTIVSPNRN